MKLELCIKLKEAGFPQPDEYRLGQWWVKHNNEIKLWSVLDHINHVGESREYIAYQPTITELEDAVIELIPEGSMTWTVNTINDVYHHYQAYDCSELGECRRDSYRPYSSHNPDRFLAIAELYPKIRREM